MNIEIEKVGLISEGDMKGWYIRVDDDAINTGGFLILYNSCPNMSSSSGYDDWVENKKSLKDFFAESSWNIKWLE
jgi:hypothetical protein